jgi:hypothetical protein
MAKMPAQRAEIRMELPPVAVFIQWLGKPRHQILRKPQFLE